MVKYPIQKAFCNSCSHKTYDYLHKTIGIQTKVLRLTDFVKCDTPGTIVLFSWGLERKSNRRPPAKAGRITFQLIEIFVRATNWGESHGLQWLLCPFVWHSVATFTSICFSDCEQWVHQCTRGALVQPFRAHPNACKARKRDKANLVDIAKPLSRKEYG